jgi:rhodanese-related sulfurtransferase
MSKVELISSRQYLRRRDELFKRVSPTTCRELIDDFHDQTENIFEMGRNNNDDDGIGSNVGGGVNRSDVASVTAPLSPSAEPVIAQINAEDYTGGIYNEAIERAPFLFLDVREKKEYNVCHIKCARSFPSNHLRQDKITPELHHYRNRDGHVIVVYDLDDRMGRGVATMFTEKGYENIFLLTGGLERFASMHPTLCAGELLSEGKENKSKAAKAKAKSGRKKGGIGGRPPRPEYTAKVGSGAPKGSGRPPRAPRNTTTTTYQEIGNGGNSGGNSGGVNGGPQLTTANVKANERAHRTGGTPSKRGRSRGGAPSLAGSTQSRAESLLSWNAGERHLQTSL